MNIHTSYSQRRDSFFVSIDGETIEARKDQFGAVSFDWPEHLEDLDDSSLDEDRNELFLAIAEAIDSAVMLMNPHTGSVDTREGWEADMESWAEGDMDQATIELSDLVEVEYDYEECAWVEA